MNKGEIIIYQSEDGHTELNVRLDGDTVWLSQAQIAHLFQTDRTSIVRHINNIYRNGELKKEATCAIFTQVQTEGTRQVRRSLPLYTLDMIISVGYRVKSKQATQFRIWANRVLKEYLVQGYAVRRDLQSEQLEELKRTIAVMSNVLAA